MFFATYASDVRGRGLAQPYASGEFCFCFSHFVWFLWTSPPRTRWIAHIAHSICCDAVIHRSIRSFVPFAVVRRRARRMSRDDEVEVTYAHDDDDNEEDELTYDSDDEDYDSGERELRRELMRFAAFHNLPESAIDLNNCSRGGLIYFLEAYRASDEEARANFWLHAPTLLEERRRRIEEETGLSQWRPRERTSSPSSKRIAWSIERTRRDDVVLAIDRSLIRANTKPIDEGGVGARAKT